MFAQGLLFTADCTADHTCLSSTIEYEAWWFQLLCLTMVLLVDGLWILSCPHSPHLKKHRFPAVPFSLGTYVLSGAWWGEHPSLLHLLNSIVIVMLLTMHPELIFHKADDCPSQDFGCPVLLDQEQVECAVAIEAEGPCLEHASLQCHGA